MPQDPVASGSNTLSTGFAATPAPDDSLSDASGKLGGNGAKTTQNLESKPESGCSLYPRNSQANHNIWYATIYL